MRVGFCETFKFISNSTSISIRFESSFTTRFQLNRHAMKNDTAPDARTHPQQPSEPSFRSSAVAGRAGMPVATLRIWEQRYQAVAPMTTPTGHRLYSMADVQRVVLLRRLTLQGHAIRTLAPLSLAQLTQLEQSLPLVRGLSSWTSASKQAPVRVVIIGQAMAQRIQRKTVQTCLVKSPELLGVFATLADALQASPDVVNQPVDLLLWQVPDIFPSDLADLDRARRALSPRKTAVVYRFAASDEKMQLARAGISAIREPHDDGVLAKWLAALESALIVDEHSPGQPDSATPITSGYASDANWQEAPPRKFDDATLTRLAGLPSKVACECPRHLAELLMQIASFEAYSGGCEHRHAADAALHSYLHRVASSARVMFESALERVGREEGLLPEAAPTTAG